MLDASEDATRLGLLKESSYFLAYITRGPIHQIDARFHLPELDGIPVHAKANALFAIGISKLRVNRNAEAVGMFERALQERPEWGTARFMLAYAHAYAGHRVEADRGFKDARRFGWTRPRGL